jgi:membrane protein implicated in regulation of membrane protease activity
MSQGTGIFESSKSLFQSGIVLTMMGFGWFCIQVVILLAEINTHIGILVSVGIVILLIYSWISMNRARARVKID